jgi:hypothetical protein
VGLTPRRKHDRETVGDHEILEGHLYHLLNSNQKDFSDESKSFDMFRQKAPKKIQKETKNIKESGKYGAE